MREAGVGVGAIVLVVMIGVIIGMVRAMIHGSAMVSIGTAVLVVVLAGGAWFFWKWFKAMGISDSNLEPLEFACTECKTKFQAAPLEAPADQILSAPCTVFFRRLPALKGVNDEFALFLNGRRLAWVKNNQFFEFQTVVRYNDVFVTTKSGTAFKGHRSFEAQPGGRVELQFSGIAFV